MIVSSSHRPQIMVSSSHRPQMMVSSSHRPQMMVSLHALDQACASGMLAVTRTLCVSGMDYTPFLVLAVGR